MKLCALGDPFVYASSHLRDSDGFHALRVIQALQSLYVILYGSSEERLAEMQL